MIYTLDGEMRAQAKGEIPVGIWHPGALYASSQSVWNAGRWAGSGDLARARVLTG